MGIDTTSHDALHFIGKFIPLSVAGSHLKSAQERQTERTATLTGSQDHHSSPGEQANKSPECDSFGVLSSPSKVGGGGGERVEGRRVLFPRLFLVRRLSTEGIGAPFLIHTSLLGFYLLQKISLTIPLPKAGIVYFLTLLYVRHNMYDHLKLHISVSLSPSLMLCKK